MEPIKHNTNFNPIKPSSINSYQLSYSPLHWTNLITKTHSQNHSSPECTLNNLPNTSSSLPLPKILDEIYEKISKQQTIDSQIRQIRANLKFLYSLQTTKPDSRLEYEEWMAHMYLSMTDYLLNLNLITLAYKSLETALPSFQSESIKAIFHLRIASILLQEDDLDLVQSHLLYATSLSREIDILRRECELCSARLTFHRGNFVKSFKLFTQLSETRDHDSEPVRTYLITMRIISAIMVPPRLRQSHLQKVQEYLTHPQFSRFQDLFKTISSNSIIIPHSKPYKSFASLLPPCLISNGTFKDFIRIHNLWSQSTKPNDISSSELLSLLDFQTPEQSKTFIQQRTETEHLKVQTILCTDPKDSFCVRFTRCDQEDEPRISPRIELISKHLASFTLPSRPPNRSKPIANSSVIEPIIISPDTSENESDQDRSSLMEMDFEMIQKTTGLRKKFEKEGIWKELNESSSTIKESLLAFQKTKQTHQTLLPKPSRKSAPEGIPKEKAVYLSRLETYLNFYKSIKPLSGWPITLQKIMIWKQFNPMTITQFEKYCNVFEFARRITFEMFSKKYNLKDLSVHESIKRGGKKGGRMGRRSGMGLGSESGSSSGSGSGFSFRKEVKKKPSRRKNKEQDQFIEKVNQPRRSNPLRNGNRKRKVRDSSSSDNEEEHQKNDQRVKSVRIEEGSDGPAIRDTPALCDTITPNLSDPVIQDHLDQVDLPGSNHDDELLNDEPMGLQQQAEEEEEIDEIDEIDLPEIHDSTPIINKETFGSDDSEDEKPTVRDTNRSQQLVISELSWNTNQKDFVADDLMDDEVPAIVDDLEEENLEKEEEREKEEKEEEKEEEHSLGNTTTDQPTSTSTHEGINTSESPDPNTNRNRNEEMNEGIINALSIFSKALRSF